MAQKAYYPFEIRIEYNNIETVMVVRRATENKHKFYGRIKTNDLTGIEPDIIIEKKESWIPAETWQKPATKYMKDDACIQLVGAAIDIHMVRNHSYRQ